MQLHAIDYILWWTPAVVMIAIAAYMLRAKIYRDFPFFFNFVVFQVVVFAVEFPLHNRTYFFYISWVSTELTALVSFAVLLEIIHKVVGRFKDLRHWNVALFGWCALVVVVVATLQPFTSQPGSLLDNVLNSVFLTDRTVRIAQCVLALCMIVFSTAIGISKRDLVFGVSAGFGFFAVVNLLVVVSLTHNYALSRATLSRLNGAAYVISVLIWLAYAAAAAKEDAHRSLPSVA